MIIALIGNIGEGKTLSMVKEIVTSNGYPVTNFRMKHIKYHRLKFSDIFKVDKGSKTASADVNWKFWEDMRNEHPDFSIYIDEAHNLIDSRASMSKKNRIMSKWISQVRKILSDKKDNHCWLITQVPKRIDVNFRDLTHLVIECQKLIVQNRVYIVQSYYKGFQKYEMGRRFLRTYFKGNEYFKYYDTNDMVRFEDAEVFV